MQKFSVQLKEISADQAGQRVDNFLIAELKGAPRSLVYKIIRKGQVRVNSKRIKPTYKLIHGDVVRIPPVHINDEKTVKAPTKLVDLLENSIIYEDDRLIVLNKPTGIAVHGGSGILLGLIEAARQIRPQHNLELIHRLDRDTSGCLMLAKKRSCLRIMHEKMRLNQIEKIYHVVVAGHFPTQLTATEPLLKRHTSSGDWHVIVSDKGQYAKTHFKLISYNEGWSLVEAKLATGRTHQIRVHLAHHGFPVAGCAKYSDRLGRQKFKQLGCKRMMLHAQSLIFKHPVSEQLLTLEAAKDPVWSEFTQNIGLEKGIAENERTTMGTTGFN